jgi:hypothetical protein
MIQDDIGRALLLLHGRGDIRVQCVRCGRDLTPQEFETETCPHCGTFDADGDDGVRFYHTDCSGSA